MKKTCIIAALIVCAAITKTLAQTGNNYKIVDTRQTKTFDNKSEIEAPKQGEKFYGQDAQHNGNQPSYTDNGDGTITDNVTGLVWQKNYEIMSYKEARKAVKKFNLAGQKDWRIPNIKEAYSLIMFDGQDVSPQVTGNGGTNGVPFIDTDFFDFKYAANGARAIDSQMLSSTKYAGSTDENDLIFGVNFADGRIKGYGMQLGQEEKKFVVRFVRGAAYGKNSFKNNGDGTVSDNASGLMWQRGDSQKAMDWEEALAYAEQMNREGYLGYSDWRVPNAKELQSIVDYGRSPLSHTSAAIAPVFEISVIQNEAGQDDYPFFWSSTTHENSAVGDNAGSAGVYVAFGRCLGNMAAMRGRGGQGARGGQGGQGGQGQRPQQGGGGQGGGGGQMRGGQGQGRGRGNSGTVWVDVHGAGAQRSDPKSGDASKFANGNGPQGDAIRIYNHVRLVRDL